MAKQKEPTGPLDWEGRPRVKMVFNVVGTTPMLCNRMSKKAKETLLLGAPPITRDQRQRRMKHDPPAEFRESAERLRQEDEPTLVAVMTSAFKKAMLTAATDIPGVAKAMLARQVTVMGYKSPVWGRPYLHMSTVRAKDINHTPDIRTRACLPRWASRIQVEYPPDLITERTVIKLLLEAGRTVGVGDGRQEKGWGTFGCFMLVNNNDPEFLAILKEGREVQQEAFDTAEVYDEDSQELMEFWTTEVERRGLQPKTAEEAEAELAEDTEDYMAEHDIVGDGDETQKFDEEEAA